MANPQLEDGYIKIASEIARELTRINLFPYESRVLWCILVKTYGFHKKEDWITLTQFSKFTGLDKRLVSRAIRKLKEKKIITTKKINKRVIYYKFQKDHEKWKGKVSISTDDELSSKPMTVIINSDDETSSKQMPTKDTVTKDTVTKDTVTKEKPKEVTDELLQLYNSTEHLSKIRIPISPERRKKLITRCLSEQWIEDFKKALPKADKLRRLCPDTTWLNFDFIIRNSDNASKIAEGSYDWKWKDPGRGKAPRPANLGTESFDEDDHQLDL